MPKAEWGAKRSCPECSTRFYDLNADPATCPDCEHQFEIASLYQSDIRAASSKKAAAASKADPLEDGDELLEDDADIDVGDELLEEDDDDSTVSIEEIADVPANDDDD